MNIKYVQLKGVETIQSQFYKSFDIKNCNKKNMDQS
jgi:hypothetical protein